MEKKSKPSVEPASAKQQTANKWNRKKTLFKAQSSSTIRFQQILPDKQQIYIFPRSKSNFFFFQFLLSFSLLSLLCLWNSISLYYEFSKEQDYICSKPEDSGMHKCADLPPYRHGPLTCNGKHWFSIFNYVRSTLFSPSHWAVNSHTHRIHLVSLAIMISGRSIEERVNILTFHRSYAIMFDVFTPSISLIHRKHIRCL